MDQKLLLFRKFALKELSLPAVTSRDFSQDSAADFLALSLQSIEEHLFHTQNLRRLSGELFSVQAGYFDCASPNARSVERDGVHLLGFHVGLGAAVFEFSLFCFSQRKIFKNCGDAQSEGNPEAVDGYPPGFWMRERGAVLERDAFLKSANSIIPKCPRRYDMAVLLSILMMRFVWFHELYHAVNGHAGLVAVSDIRLGLSETDKSVSNAIKPETMSLLELDADQSALSALCRVFPAELENIEGLRHLSSQENLTLSLFAAYSSTWILDEYLLRRGVGVPDDHPHPKDRRQNLVRTFASVFAEKMEGAKEIHDNVLHEMTVLSAIISRFPSGDHLRQEMNDKTLQADLDEKQAKLTALRERLESFKFS